MATRSASCRRPHAERLWFGPPRLAQTKKLRATALELKRKYPKLDTTTFRKIDNQWNGPKTQRLLHSSSPALLWQVDHDIFLYGLDIRPLAHTTGVHIAYRLCFVPLHGIRSEGRTSPRIFFFDLRKRMKRYRQKRIPKSQRATPVTNIIYALRTPELTTLGWINILKSEQRDHNNYPGFDGHTSPHFHKSGRHISLQIGKFPLTHQRTFPILSGCSRTRSHRIFPFFYFRTDCSGPL